jgi:tetrahydromethanopterin S-methyltransferase subunit A
MRILKNSKGFYNRVATVEDETCKAQKSEDDIADVPLIEAEEPGKLELDSAGYFVIVPQPDKRTILAKHYSYDKELLRMIEGPDARSIYRTMVRYEWVSTLNHAAYLGQELTRAEIAMKAGFVYVQE